MSDETFVKIRLHLVKVVNGTSDNVIRAENALSSANTILGLRREDLEDAKADLARFDAKFPELKDAK